MRPIIGITMGDPAGIGPEITIRTCMQEELYRKCRPLVIGDSCVLEKAKRLVGGEHLKIHSIQEPAQAEYTYGTLDVLDMHMVDIEALKIGEISEMAGNAAFAYVEKAIKLAMAGAIDATVTNALNKEAINLAGHHFAGHTEIYAEYTKTKKYSMLLVYENLRVIHVSTHVSLRKACDMVTRERVLEVIRLADTACRAMNITRPKIAVAGLNPHCGESGLFGFEETEEIEPAVAEARKEGIDVEGPVPPDTVFSKANGGWYDIVVAMYHDQGHIPLKVLGFQYNQTEKKWNSVEGVNITLGLPVIRTSVDHGTAFDQAGKGTASELSLKNAVDYAIDFANSKNFS